MCDCSFAPYTPMLKNKYLMGYQIGPSAKKQSSTRQFTALLLDPIVLIRKNLKLFEPIVDHHFSYRHLVVILAGISNDYVNVFVHYQSPLVTWQPLATV